MARFYREWQDFIKKIGPNPVSSRPYWQRINRLRTGKNKTSNIPYLKFNDKKYENDNDKANLFKDILKDTFQLSDDDSFKDKPRISNQCCLALERLAVSTEPTNNL